MNLRTVSTAVVVACALALPNTPALAAPTPTSTPFGVSSVASPATLVQAAKKKPKAVVTATFTTLAPTNKVSVEVNSNAKQVQVKYRTAKNRKRALNKKLKGGTATIILPVGSQKILLRAKATSRLATSPWTAATPPVLPVAPPVAPVAQPVAPPVAPPVTPPVVTPPVDPPVNPPVTSGAILRVNTSSSGGQAVGYNEMSGPVFSPDGTQVAFSSRSSNLVDGDTNGFEDIFVKTLESGAIERISTNGVQTDASSRHPRWSPDGSRIAFWSWASNLVNNDANELGDLFVKDLSTGAVQLVSTDATGTQADCSSSPSAPIWSPDSTRIAFTSLGCGLVAGDTNDSADVFVKTLGSGAIQRISTDTTGTQADGYSTSPTWSPDGTQVAFSSDASNLVDADTNDAADVFVKTLSNGAIQRISTTAGAGQADGYSDDPVWSPNSGQVAFTSTATNLIDADTNGASDVFVKTLATGAIERVSTTATGGQGDDASLLSWDTPASMWSLDGTRIVFVSWASNLVDGDTNGNSDIFIKNLTTGTIERTSINAYGQQADNVSREPSWSRDGNRIVFGSRASNLIDGDTNTEYDIFIKTLS